MNNKHDTESIDKLFLELSQFTTARTARERELLAHIMTLRGALKGLLIKPVMVSDFTHAEYVLANTAYLDPGVVGDHSD